MVSACCGPERASSATADQSRPRVRRGRPPASITKRLVALDGGTFLMGTEDEEGFPADGEGPVRDVALRGFRIAPKAVTNAQFATFVKATDYCTDAERYGWSFVFYGFIPSGWAAKALGPADAPWWRAVDGAYWKAPEGPGSDIGVRQNHPVVHVSHNDATAFCEWAGVRLPTEAEWEYAARGGLRQRRYAWGDELTPRGAHRCNIWQGTFPMRNLEEDGYAGTAPVDAYRPNGFGLYNVAGNVWEWCSDWFSPDFHVTGPRVDPTGPPSGVARVVRGGSYLCHRSYCNRYRVAARTKNTPDSSTGNTGFRYAADIDR